MNIGQARLEISRSLNQSLGRTSLYEINSLTEAVTKLDANTQLIRGRQELTKSEINKLHFFIQRRINHEPVEYITKKVKFLNRNFYIDHRVLIPRPETEELVSWLINLVNRPGKILDIGTGSGVIAITLKLAWPDSQVLGTDICLRALTVARLNNRRLKAGVRFKQADLLKGVNGQYDLIIANLPYISPNQWKTLSPSVRLYEPKYAIVASDKGLGLIKDFLKQARLLITSKTIIALELDSERAIEVLKLARQIFTEHHLNLKKDQFGRSRYLLAYPVANENLFSYADITCLKLF